MSQRGMYSKVTISAMGVWDTERLSLFALAGTPSSGAEDLRRELLPEEGSDISLSGLHTTPRDEVYEFSAGLL